VGKFKNPNTHTLALSRDSTNLIKLYYRFQPEELYHLASGRESYPGEFRYPGIYWRRDRG